MLSFLRYFSLYTKLVAVNILALTAAIVVIVALGERTLQKTLIERTQFDVHETQLLLNLSLASLVAARDYEGLNDALAQLPTQKGIRYLLVQDHTGKTIGQQGEAPVQSNSAQEILDLNADAIHSKVPLEIAGQQYGTVYFGLSLDHIRDYRRRLPYQITLVALVVLVIAAGLIIVISFYVTRPLRDITRAAREIGKGNFAVELPRGPRDEVGQLAAAFKVMKNALREKLDNLRSNQEMFNAIADYTPSCESWLNPQGKLLWINSAVQQLTGFSREECYSSNDFPRMLIMAAEQETVMTKIKEAIHMATSQTDYQFSLCHKEGHTFWGSATWQPIYNASGEYLGIRISLENIETRKKAQFALEKTIDELSKTQEAQRQLFVELQSEHARLIALLSAMEGGILLIDTEGRINYCNPGLLQIWQLPVETAVHNRLAATVLHASSEQLLDPATHASWLQQLTDPTKAPDHLELTFSDGRTITQQVFPVKSERDETVGYLVLFEDVSGERATAVQLTYLAERDTLTGLYNRYRFHEELNRLIAHAQRTKGNVALLFFDLDEFKNTNDTYGHRAGDVTLVRVASEMLLQVRQNEFLCRLGGDEFAVLAPDCDPEGASALAERLIRSINGIGLSFDGQPIRLSTSVGIAIYPQHANNPEDLVSRADTAMYQAKEAGKNTWRLYRLERDTSRLSVTNMNWHERLNHALKHNLLLMHFQGIYNAADLSLSHLEALLRLINDAENGEIIPPAQFIRAAEKTGVIVELDRWVIKKCVDLLSTKPNLPGIAINLSGRSLDDPQLPRFISETLEHTRVHPNRLLVELTETSAVEDIHDAQRFISALQKMGCRVCLDDFGSGFSSFSYLKHLNTDIVKIDGQFIHNLATDRNNQLFVRAIIDVSRGMGKRTVAEFVEDAPSVAMLQALGIDLLQGFYFDRPQANHPALRPPLTSVASG